LPSTNLAMAPSDDGTINEGASEISAPSRPRSESVTPTPKEKFDYYDAIHQAENFSWEEAGGLLSSQPEIHFAEFEVNIRQFCHDLVSPTVRKAAKLEHAQRSLEDDSAIKTAQIADLMRVAQKIEQQVNIIEGFRQEMTKFDLERRQWQGEATESLTTMKQDMDAFRYQLERQEGSVHGSQRTVDRVAGELGRIQESADLLRENTERRLNHQTKTLNTFKADLEVKLVGLEARHNQLSDDLWGEETGLAKVMHDLSRTNEVVSGMSSELSSMKYDKASISQLQAVQEEVNSFTNEANNNVNALKQTVDRMMSDVKSHFKTATNTVAANNAAMLQEVRAAYQEELADAAKVRAEVIGFMEQEHISRKSLEDSLCKSQVSTEDLVKKVAGEVEEVGKLRRRDRNNQEVEIQKLFNGLQGVQDASQQVAANLDHCSEVLWTLVQCERAASALDLQDDQDRSKIALMGYKDETKEKGRRGNLRSQSPNPEKVVDGHGHRPASRGSASKDAGDTVISVDERCLSCCGKQQTVLSGFKMACLQYQAAPVNFARKTFNRGELLTLREKLLSQAQDSLRSGPVQFEKIDLFGATNTSMPSAVAIVDALMQKTDKNGSEPRQSVSFGRPKTGMPPIPTATPR